jgi:hypothetical protein
MANSGNFSAISGSWQVPSPTGNSTNTSADSSWIGIGGVTTSDLIQIGTVNTVSASGQVSSSGFYELLPGASITVPGLSISAGDQMTANIDEVSSGQWVMTITDTTSGQSFVKDVSYSSSNSSAEWIEEDPSYSAHHQIPFDNFHTVNFEAASTVSNGSTENLNTSNAQPITLVSSQNQPIATPSSIGSDNASFSVNHD